MMDLVIPAQDGKNVTITSYYGNELLSQNTYEFASEEEARAYAEEISKIDYTSTLESMRKFIQEKFPNSEYIDELALAAHTMDHKQFGRIINKM